ncbi:MAG TPA: glutaredoxin family protein [Pseudomonadales bacterium]|nr:glutaredoxin family protein [Pseudomonadales bacterium]
MPLILYTTLGCHLCERVEDMLTELSGAFSFHLTKIDIAEDDALLAAYATEIPVLLREDIHMDIAWPFDIEHLAQFLALAEET